MQKLGILFVSFILVQSSFGQEGTTVRKTQLQKPQSIYQPLQTQHLAADTMKGETIEHCDATIRAIDIKVNHVNSDETEKQKALASGWFDQMAKHRAAYVARREYLLKQTTNK